MASIFDNPSAKAKCQIFTPNDIVSSMLDIIGYKEDLFGKKILDNSCGDGQFLKEIVHRYIQDCNKRKLSSKVIQAGLSEDIWGVELDAEPYNKCIQELHSIVHNYGIGPVEWKIFNADSLRTSISLKYDYIVGNPPYLSYWDITEEERNYLKSKFVSCEKGAFDYCFAFIESAISMLNKTGSLIYIIPSSTFKTKSGESLRELIKPFVRSIYDYRTKKVFDNALTSSVIIFLDKSVITNRFDYYDMVLKDTIDLDKDGLTGAWIFKTPERNGLQLEHRFGDYFRVSSSVATQYNQAFVLIDWQENEALLIGPSGQQVEKQATWKAASPKGKINNQNERIIFPYEFVDGKRRGYDENEYKAAFPLAYAYLSTQKSKLLKRDADKKSAWFEFGRSQALDHLLCPKILLSTVITNSINVFRLEISEIPYSGLYIVPIRELSIDEGINLLRSKAFLNYIESVGVNINGNSIRVTAQNIRDFRW